MENIFDSINQSASENQKQEAEAARKREQGYEAAIAAKRANRSKVLRENRRRATFSLVKNICVSAVLAALICWTNSAGLIAPQIMPWELMFVVAYLFYCVGCWTMCMAFWRE